ncbi:MAG: flagellar hook-associated protein 3 [Paraglaciecola sp.]|nr:flagellar hook-associated protein 3 [Paraglaciecola sp.]NCT48355.1 flagellar hook-associated protein 3 [Paraglaciecola sp.]
MRISTAQLYDRSIQAVLDNQGDLSDIQQQLASGKKLLRPSDDPVGAAQVIRLTEEIDLISQYKKNNNLVTNSLEQEETVLSNINTALNRARVLMIQAGNGILNVDDRAAISSEVKQIRDQVFDLMNSRNSAGEYIFAGYQSASPAFGLNQSATGNKYTYQGDDGFNQIRVSDTVKLQVNNNGKEVFEDVLARLKATLSSSVGATSASVKVSEQGNFDKFHKANYDAVTPLNNEFQATVLAGNQVQISNVGTGQILDTIDFASGVPFSFRGLSFQFNGTVGASVNFQLNTPEKQNIAETLNNFVLALNDRDISETDYQNALSDALVGTDNAMNKIGTATSAIGGRLNVAESVLNATLDLEITNKSARSNIEDVDYAEAVSELSRQETALEAAQATFARVTGTSLFDYIR